MSSDQSSLLLSATPQTDAQRLATLLKLAEHLAEAEGIATLEAAEMLHKALHDPIEEKR